MFKNMIDSFKKKLLKRLLKERMFKMNTLDVKDFEYIIDGKVYNDKEIVDMMMDWATRYFIFRNNDVFLPEVPPALITDAFKEKYPELDTNKFIDKFGNIALKYLMYNAFLIGYEAGIANKSNEVDKQIEERVEESTIEEEKPIVHSKRRASSKKETIIVDNSDKIEEETVDHIIDGDEIANSIKEELNKSESKEEIIKDEDKEEEIPTSKRYIPERIQIDKNLVIDSSAYPDRTYEKFISSVIENKLHQYGMTPSDMLIKSFPTYILGEVLNEIENSDAINDDQVAVRTKFYNYVKDIHEDLTKINTTT